MDYDEVSDLVFNRLHCVSKALTPPRMHENGFEIGQIIAECHSFPDMYDMLKPKVDPLAGETYFVQKNTPKTACLSV